MKWKLRNVDFAIKEIIIYDLARSIMISIMIPMVSTRLERDSIDRNEAQHFQDH
jgi:hypothetical protein